MDDLVALSEFPGLCIDGVHRCRTPKMIVLDIDSSMNSACGKQESSTHEDPFGCTCCYPLFVINQFGDPERRALWAGNVHSADGWRDVLETIVAVAS